MRENPNTVALWDERYSTANRSTPEGALAALPTHAPLYKAIVDAMRHGAGEIDILDVGAGVGQVAHLFVQRYGLPKIASYTALDFSAVAHGAFLDAFGRFGNMRFVRENIGEAVLKDLAHRHSGFDLIVCAEVLEHLSDDEGVARGIRAALRSCGRAVVSVPSRPGIRLHLRHYDDAAFDARIGASMQPCRCQKIHIADRWIVGIFEA